MKGVGGTGFEGGIESPAEPCRVRSLSVDQECPRPDSIGHGSRLKQRIADELRSEPLVLVAAIDAQAAEEDDRYGMSAHAASEPRRCIT